MNKTKPWLLLFLPVLFAVFSAKSQPASWTKMAEPLSAKNLLKDKAMTTTSLNASFTQEKFLSVLEEKIVSTGVFLFRKDEKLLWRYQQPFEYLILRNGSRMWIKEEKKVKSYDMASNPVFREINNLMVGLVDGSFFSSADFSQEFFENRSHFKVLLTPEKSGMKTFLSVIELLFDKESLLVSEAVLREPGEDYTRIIFQDRKWNESLADSVFVLH